MRVAATMLLIALSVPAVAADRKADAAKDPNRVICRREIPVGSLIASRKVCLTKAQWDERATRGNEEARKQIEENAARNATPSG